MREDVDHDMQSSTADFCRYVWPYIAAHISGGRLVVVESATVRHVLDTHAGIDYLQVLDTGVRGLAARVQWGRCYNTFTVRFQRRGASPESTECFKHAQAVKHGLLRPHITVQAYLGERGSGPLLAAGIVRSDDLDRYLTEGGAFTVKDVRGGQAQFHVVRWDDLRAHGVPIKVIRNEVGSFNLDKLIQASLPILAVGCAALIEFVLWRAGV